MILSSLLCFLDSAWCDYGRDPLLDIAYTFYSEEDINDAKVVLLQALNVESTTRKNPGKKKRDLNDIIDVLTNYKLNSDSGERHVFVCKDYKEIPPSGYDTISPTLSLLTDEVNKIKEDYSNLCNSMKEVLDVVTSVKHDENMFLNLKEDICSQKMDLLDIKQSIRSLMRVTLGDEMRRLSISVPSTPSLKVSVDNEIKDSFSTSIAEACCSDQNLLNDVINDMRFNEPPSAPELSQLESDDLNRDIGSGQIVCSQVFGRSITNECNEDISPAKSPIDRHDSIFPRTFSSVAASKPFVKSSTAAPMRQKPSQTIIVRNTNKSSFKGKITDNDGYTLKISQRKSTTGTKKNFGSVSFKSANRVTDLYIGRCEKDLTVEKLNNYITTELGVNPLNCIQIATKIMYATAFKVTVGSDDRFKLFDSDSWPEGVICRRYISGKKDLNKPK